MRPARAVGSGRGTIAELTAGVGPKLLDRIWFDQRWSPRRRYLGGSVSYPLRYAFQSPGLDLPRELLDTLRRRRRCGDRVAWIEATPIFPSYGVVSTACSRLRIFARASCRRSGVAGAGVRRRRPAFRAGRPTLAGECSVVISAPLLSTGSKTSCLGEKITSRDALGHTVFTCRIFHATSSVEFDSPGRRDLLRAESGDSSWLERARATGHCRNSG